MFLYVAFCHCIISVVWCFCCIQVLNNVYQICLSFCTSWQCLKTMNQAFFFSSLLHSQPYIVSFVSEIVVWCRSPGWTLLNCNSYHIRLCMALWYLTSNVNRVEYSFIILLRSWMFLYSSVVSPVFWETCHAYMFVCTVISLHVITALTW